MKFPDRFLDDIRSALKASDVVGRFRKLRRAGKEFVAADDASLTVNDQKGLIHDFGKTAFTGDIFGFWMAQHGCTFVVAVEELAKLAGMPLPDGKGDGRRSAGNSRPVKSDDGPPAEQFGDPGPQGSTFGDGAAAAAAGGNTTKRQIVKTYPYTDQDGGLRYEVCRSEWMEKGKRRKTFSQRRPVPGEPGAWMWGLDEGDYIRPDFSKDYYKATEERLEKWRVTSRKTIQDTEPHVFYRLPELVEEVAQDPADRRTIFINEGEKDTETVAAWDLVSTTVSGGARYFEATHAEQLRGCDVVILTHNDKAGREGGHKKALLLRGVAARVRMLNWRDHWAACPDKGDVTDWREAGGGTREKFLAIVDRLLDWTPEPPETSFNAVRFIDLDKPARELEWLIKRVLTRGEVSIWWGQPSCGKSFLITDAAMAIAQGKSWFGLRTRPGLAVYQAGEGGLGLKRRLRAYRQSKGLPAKQDLPFVLLPSRVNLFADEADTDKLIAEIKAWAAYYDAPLELVVIDTFSAASTGANENASEDVGRVLQRCHKMAVETGAHVALVHHTPKGGGSPRGWSGITGNVENSIEVLRTEQKDTEVRSDGSKTQRDLRQFIIRKQKDGEDGETWSFVLKQVVLGTDIDGDKITSCIVDPVNVSVDTPKIVPPGYSIQAGNNVTLLRALQRALDERGMPPPNHLKLPDYVSKVVHVSDWRQAMVDMHWPPDPVNDPEGKKLISRCKKAIERTYTEAKQPWDQPEPKGANLIGKVKEFVWRTPRKVFRVDDPPPPRNLAPPPSMAELPLDAGETDERDMPF